VRRLPDEAAAEPVASPLRPPQAAEVLAAAVRRREAPVAVARPRVASDARPQPAAVVAGGSPAAEAEAAGSPAAAVPAAAPVACQTAVAPPMAACGWRCQAAVQQDGPAGDRRQEVAACRVQQPAQPNSARPWAVVLPAAPPAASGWLCPAAARHPEDGGSPVLVDPTLAVRCSAPQCSELCCLEPRSSAQPRSA